MSKFKMIAGVVLAAAVFMGVVPAANAFAAGKKKAVFKVRVENVANKDGIVAVDGSKYPFALSPGFYAVTQSRADLVMNGKTASAGVEAQAEDGDPSVLARLVSDLQIAGSFGVFNLPVGGDKPSPILSGGSYEFMFMATEGMRLNILTMYGQSNDLFYAPEQPIELFGKNGEPLTGDITAKFVLWDAGTEVNQAPGLGADQGPRQAMKNTGTAENGVVHPVNDGFKYPATADVLRITITAN